MRRSVPVCRFLLLCATVNVSASESGDIPVNRNMNNLVSTIDGKLYLFGGYQNDCLNDFYIYSPAQEMWTSLPTGPSPRDTPGMTIATDGNIYVFGGNNCVCEYQASQDGSMGFTSSGNNLYLFGGYTGESKL